MIRRRSGIAGRRVAQPAAGDQPQDHRAQRGDEAQRRVAAAVGDKRRLARQQVEEPHVEGLPEVAVLVPVRRQPAVVMRPVRRHADRLIVESRPGHGIQRPGEPVAGEHDPQGGPLRPDRAEPEQEQERVAQADLGQRVLEGEVGLPAVHRAQEDTERDEHDRSPEGMTKQRSRALSLGLAARHRKRQGHADQKRERGLDQVVQRAAGPVDMRLVIGQEPEIALDGKRLGQAAQLQHLGHHQQHHEPAIGIDGDVSGGIHASLHGGILVRDYADLIGITPKGSIRRFHRFTQILFWDVRRGRRRTDTAPDLC